MPSDNKCVHCGADCGKNPVIWNNMQFCCHGCEQVYRLLNENKMHQYYDLQSNPGIRVEEHQYDTKYAYLDKDEVQKKMFEFHENNIAKITFYIPSIHCASCIWLLEHLNKLNKGVKHSVVNFINKTYTVSFNTDEISLRQLVELLVSIHYIPDLSLSTLEKPKSKGVDRKLMYKIGVAGFVFGNVMLYSLPEYFNGKPLGDSLGTFLYYLTYILTVPLVFYSGSDYLVSAFKNLRKGIVNIDLPIAIGIITLFVVTSFEVISGAGPGYSDSLSGFLFFLLIGRWYQGKTYQALSFDRDFKSYFPVAVTRVVDGQEESALLEELKAGDELLIRSKELIPTDATIKHGTGLIDYSFVTGESTPVRKEAGEFVYAGGRQTSGAINITVEKEVSQSHLTQLWNQNSDDKPSERSLKSIIDKISVYFTVVIILIALAGFGYWFALGHDFKTAILVLTSVLIVACPCALALSMPFTFGSTMRLFGKHGMYIKNTGTIEKLTRIDTIVFDKTGTITRPDESRLLFHGTPLTQKESEAIASLTRQSTHPLSNAITQYLNHTKTLPVIGFVEMSGRGIYGKANGLALKLGSAEYILNEDTNSNKASMVHLTINGAYRGYFSIHNKYREGVDVVLKGLKKQFQLYLLSGDNDSERSNLLNYFDADKIYFNQQPADKQNFIKELQKQGRNVLMTGDGLNDAGAFMTSDVALSIADDIYHFSPAGDAIIDAKQFHQLGRFISFGQSALGIVKLSFILSLLYNVIGLGFALTGHMSPVVAAILMPISSISVVAFATFATRFMSSRKLSS